MTKYEQLDCVSVSNENDKITFIFLDTKAGEIHNVVWRKQRFNRQTQEYEDDPAKMEKLREWSDKYFGLELENITDAVGSKMDIYAYDTFDSLWECDKRFDPKKDVNQIINTEIRSIDLTNEGIVIHYQWNGDTYASNMKFTESFDGVFYPNPQKRARQLRKFEEKFGVPIEEKDTLIGQQIMVEVKKIGQFAYGDIKALPK